MTRPLHEIIIDDGLLSKIKIAKRNTSIGISMSDKNWYYTQAEIFLECTGYKKDAMIILPLFLLTWIKIV